MVSNTGTKNMTDGNPKKMIFTFAIPIFLSQLFQQLYNSADALIVGRYIGKEALAAVSSSGPLIFLIISFFTGTSVGAGVIIARYFGANDYKKMSKAIHTNIVLGLFASVFLTIFGVIMTPTILKSMGVAVEVLPESIAYFRFYFMGITATVLYNICISTMNAVGDSKRPLVYLIISSLLNILLDIIFIKILGMGVSAAASATVISQAVSVTLCFIHLMKKGTVYQVKISRLKIDREMFINIVKYGLPTGVQNSVIGFANVLVQTNINSFGQEAMAACGSYSRIEGFVFLPVTCFSMALTTFVSQNLGAKKYDRVKEGAKFGIFTSLVLAELIGIIVFVFAPHLIGLFNGDPEVIAIGTRQCRIEGLFFFLLALSHCIAGVCRGAGKAFVPMLIMFSIWCVLRITYISVAMIINHNIDLLFWAYPITWSISSIIFIIYYLKSNWIHGFEKKD